MRRLLKSEKNIVIFVNICIIFIIVNISLKAEEIKLFGNIKYTKNINHLPKTNSLSGARIELWKIDQNATASGNTKPFDVTYTDFRGDFAFSKDNIRYQTYVLKVCYDDKYLKILEFIKENNTYNEVDFIKVIIKRLSSLALDWNDAEKIIVIRP